MANPKYCIIDLVHKDYVPVIKDSIVYYGGSQMWFPEKKWFSRDYILHNYGCGTIATADLFLYLAIHNEAYRNPLTEAVLQGTESAYYTDYLEYIRKIDGYYTKTKRFVAVLGPYVATAINDYSRMFHLNYRAKWKWSLTYYDMLEAMEEMLYLDIPVILSIGPNTPNLWGKKGISFYQQYKVELPKDKTASEPSSEIKVKEEETEAKLQLKSVIETEAVLNSEPEYKTDAMKSTEPENETAAKEFAEKVNKDNSKIILKDRNETETIYRYKPVKQGINGHYVTVTGLRKDPVAAAIMLRISSWGSEYYINYEEYRDYVNDVGGTMTSSMVYIAKKV